MGNDGLHISAYTDGGSRGNPGPAAAGLVLFDEDGKCLWQGGIFLGRATNNVAEYQGVLAALEAAGSLEATEVDLYSDSELLVRQMNGQYKVRNSGLKPLFARARKLADQFGRCTLHHVRREKNKQADALVNQALDLGSNVGDSAD